MKREIVCKKCENKLHKVFPTESPYPGEHVKFVPGKAKNHFICDQCGENILPNTECCAFSIYTDYVGQPYYEWEPEYLNLEP